MEFLLLIVLILVNGVFAMSELAVVSSKKARLKTSADRGSRGAKVALRLQEDPSRFLSTVQIGITLVGIAAGAYGATALADDLAPWIAQNAPAVAADADAIAFGLVIVLTTYLSLVIGELVPKRLALAAPEAIATFIAPPMSLLAGAAFPLVWLLRASTDGVLRVFGLHNQRQESVTEEEIHTILEEGASTGVIDAEERTMMRGVMRLADRDVRSIMTPRPEVVWLDPDDKTEAVMQEIAASGHSRFPVARADLEHVVGIVQTKDLLVASAQEGKLDLESVARPATFVPETLPVMKFLESLQGNDVRMALVVDEHGVVQGIVTAADLLGAIAGASAFSAEDGLMPPVRREDGSWLIDGLPPLDDLQMLRGAAKLAEAANGFATAAGLVMHELQRMPQVGDAITYDGVTFEVIDMDGRRIDKLLVRIEGAPPPADY